VGLSVSVCGLVLLGCGDDNGTPPTETVRFGQIGEVTVATQAPLVVDERQGELQQILTWGSSGAWVLREVISYRGLTGDETIRKSEGNPIAFASAYASLILQLNETPGIELLTVAPMGDLECEDGQTKVTVTIWDEFRGEERIWTRCAGGTLSGLKTSEAGPDLEAGRVVQAAILVRDFTQGDDFASFYVGSLPFGTLDRSEDSGAGLEEPRVFFSVPAGNPKTPTGWLAFWRDHNGTPSFLIPEVDWRNEFAVVAAVGLRREAGDSVEVRRVLQTRDNILIEVVERNPGDFCSPAARDHFPVHIIVAPRDFLPVDFSEMKQERVDCGG
jgi:hypothetical protein